MYLDEILLTLYLYQGAKQVYALITHGVLSGDAIERINASALDKVVVTNSVAQEDHVKRCPKLEVLEVGHIFAEVCASLRWKGNGSPLNRRFGGCITERVSVFCFSTIKPHVSLSGCFPRLQPGVFISEGRWRSVYMSKSHA